MPARQWRSPAAFIVNGIGDHLMALPALRALASLLPDRLRLLCTPNVRDVFFSDLPLAAVHHIHPVDPASASRASDYPDFAVAELAAAVGDCDLFLCFQRHTGPSITALMRALKPKKSIGLLPGFDIRDTIQSCASCNRLSIRNTDGACCIFAY